MATDRAATRVHCLATPPPVRSDKPLPAGAAKSCCEGPAVPCIYRGSYGCSEDDRARGLKLGRCVLELAARAETRRILDRDLHHLVLDQGKARDQLELYLDAWTYHHRAATYQSIAWEGAAKRGLDPMTSDAWTMAAGRYMVAASARLHRRTHELMPILREAAEARRRGDRDRLCRLARSSSERSIPA